jgi:3',5'-nucleoside bisphosphate phosphatase
VGAVHGSAWGSRPARSLVRVLIDLHTHSTASDGTESPAELIAAASAAGLDVVALTDHDSTAGWAEAELASQRHGIALVRGIEISCAVRGISLHLLGYLQDPGYAPLLEEIEASRVSRETRAQRIVELLGEAVDLDYSDVLAQVTPGATVGRPHIADAMVARGIVADRDEAFRDYLHSRSPYHVGHYAPDPVRAVELVVAAGGVAVMAHPFAAARGRIVDDSVIESMADAGLAGLEADHIDHTPAQVQHARELAGRLGLFVTGSSDYHGTGKVNRLGDRSTAPEVYEEIVAAARAVGVVGGR